MSRKHAASIAVCVLVVAGARCYSQETGETPSTTQLLARLKDDNVEIRRQAATTLNNRATAGFAGETSAVIDALIERLKDVDDFVAAWAGGTVLILSGSSQIPASTFDKLVPLIVTPTTNADESTRRCILTQLAVALIRLLKPSNERSDQILQIVRSAPDGPARKIATAAVPAYMSLGVVPTPPLTQLIQDLIKDVDPFISVNGMTACHEIAMKTQVTDLTVYTDQIVNAIQREPQNTPVALATLSRFRGAASSAVPYLLSIALDTTSSHSQQAVDCSIVILRSMSNADELLVDLLPGGTAAKQELLTTLLRESHVTTPRAAEKLISLLKELGDSSVTQSVAELIEARLRGVDFRSQTSVDELAEVLSKLSFVNQRGVAFLLSLLLSYDADRQFIVPFQALLAPVRAVDGDHVVKSLCLGVLNWRCTELPVDESGMRIGVELMESHDLATQTLGTWVILDRLKNRDYEHLKPVIAQIATALPQVHESNRDQLVGWLTLIAQQIAGDAAAPSAVSSLLTLLPRLHGDVLRAAGDEIIQIAKTPESRHAAVLGLIRIIRTAKNPDLAAFGFNHLVLLYLRDGSDDDKLIAEFGYACLEDSREQLANAAGSALCSTSLDHRLPKSSNAFDVLCKACAENRPPIRSYALCALGRYVAQEEYSTTSPEYSECHRILTANLGVDPGAVLGFSWVVRSTDFDTAHRIAELISNPETRVNAIFYLKSFRMAAYRDIEVISRYLDDETRTHAVTSIGEIARSIAENPEHLSQNQLQQVVQQLDVTLARMREAKVPLEQQKPVENYRRRINEIATGRRWWWWSLNGTMWFAILQATFGITAITLYPRVSFVRSIVNSNRTSRTIFGLWYVQAVIVKAPWLRSRLIAPHKDRLVEDAELKIFCESDLRGYFSGLQVSVTSYQPASEDKACATFDLSSAFGGKESSESNRHTILVGSSGSGKSTFLKWKAIQKSDRIPIFLRAELCQSGVVKAIATKFGGFFALDEKGNVDSLLELLLRYPTFDIYIDGLNEAPAAARDHIVDFASKFKECPMILGTQYVSPRMEREFRCLQMLPVELSEVPKMLIALTPVVVDRADHESPREHKSRCQKYHEDVSSFVETLVGEAESQQRVEKEFQREVLSNPFDLREVARLIGAGAKPDLRRLPFQPIERARAAFEKRIERVRGFPVDSFIDSAMSSLDSNTQDLRLFIDDIEALECLLVERVVIKRPIPGNNGLETWQWSFRHARICHAFAAMRLIPKKLGDGTRKRWDEIIKQRNPNFDGVFLLLASELSISPKDAEALRKKLDESAIITQKRSLYDAFVVRLRAFQSSAPETVATSSAEPS